MKLRGQKCEFELTAAKSMILNLEVTLPTPKETDKIILKGRNNRPCVEYVVKHLSYFMVAITVEFVKI